MCCFTLQTMQYLHSSDTLVLDVRFEPLFGFTMLMLKTGQIEQLTTLCSANAYKVSRAGKLRTQSWTSKCNVRCLCVCF